MKENTAQIVAQVPVDVGTFLLNEKRNEVHLDRDAVQGQRAAGPNRYLETPNYKVQRLRHDDLNQSEPLPASFNMVEQPEEHDPAKEMQEEAKEPRQEAVVKGITPSQPAPLPVEPTPRAVPEAARPAGWLDKVLGWFAQQARTSGTRGAHRSTQRDARAPPRRPR